MSTDLERLQRAEVDRALRALEDHLTDAAAEVRRQRMEIAAADLPAAQGTYTRAAGRALRAVTTALHNAPLDAVVIRAADAELARAEGEFEGRFGGSDTAPGQESG